jgi:hypothetical protein
MLQGLAFSALDDKPAFLIRADGPYIVVHHPHGDSVQPENAEGIPQGKNDSFSAEALSQLTGIFNPDCQTGPLISQIDPIKPDFPYQTARLDDPRIILIQKPSHPSLCHIFGHRAQITEVTSVHPKYLGVSSEP